MRARRSWKNCELRPPPSGRCAWRAASWNVSTDRAAGYFAKRWCPCETRERKGCSPARRVDIVTAGLMLKVLSALQERGTTVQIRGANELIRALFGLTGLDKVARIIPRK